MLDWWLFAIIWCHKVIGLVLYPCVHTCWQ